LAATSCALLAGMVMLSKPTAREYLVCCRGRPGAWKRMDAMARIVRAGLGKGCVVHLLFEDCTLMMLTPQFVGEGVWGAVMKATKEGELQAIFEGLCAGKKFGGARCLRPRTHQDALRAVMGGQGFDMVLSLSEDGTSLYEATARTGERPADSSSDMKLANMHTLIVLGGVRDVTMDERASLQETCRTLRVPIYHVSLGVTPELTSKCIKTFEVLAGDLGLWADALGPVVGGCQSPRSISTVSISDSVEAEAETAPLHVVVALNEALAKFLTRPAAAMLMQDVFMGSHHTYVRTRTLSLIGQDGAAVSLRVRGGRVPRTEEEASEYFRREGAGQRERGIRDLLLEDQKRRGRDDLSDLLLLRADGGAPLLRWPSRGSPDQRPVAVVFAPQRFSADIREVGGEVGAYASAAVSNLLAGPAFVGMLHSDGLLSQAICNPQCFAQP